MNYIDLRSDTVTKPTKNMREAMFNAEVGDDVYGDDITMTELEKYASDLTKKESALFVPSGTFGNQLAIFTHSTRGSEVIAGDDCHIIQHEVGAAGVISGVQFRTIDSNEGIIEPSKIEYKIRRIDDLHYPTTSLICLENAHSNGKVIPLQIMEETYNIAKKYNIPIHLDGARVFNAATYLNIEASEIIKYTTSTMFCLSKGLAAPVGSILVGDKEFIEKARKNRKLLGGGLRQSGFLAAAGLIALKEMIPNLKVDHQNALYMAKLFLDIPEITYNIDDIHINMIYFKIDTNKDLNLLEEFMLKKGVKMNPKDENNIFRFVTHHNIDKKDIDIAISFLKEFLS